jgi:protoporphyrin/coproporphyrin ferrochelatase
MLMTWLRGNPEGGSDSRGRTAVLLVNLGTPQAPTVRAVRRFLARFLRDRRVVDLPALLWWPLLYGFVLPLRPRRAARAYREIWTAQGSPLEHLTAELARKLQASFDETAPDAYRVAYAMCYSAPGVAETMRALATRGCDRLLVLPLYPQQSSSTTGAAFDQVSGELSRGRCMPTVSFVSHYYNHPHYITALASSVRSHWAKGGTRTPLLFSFHGITVRAVAQGDPYFDHCHETARLVAESLGLGRTAWSVSFQSRFGRARWLEPGTADELVALAKRGSDRVSVIAPSFAVDCLETLEEIDIRYRQLFLASGGREFQYIPALNEHDDHVRALQRIVGEYLGVHDEGVRDPRAERARVQPLPLSAR